MLKVKQRKVTSFLIKFKLEILIKKIAYYSNTTFVDFRVNQALGEEIMEVLWGFRFLRDQKC